MFYPAFFSQIQPIYCFHTSHLLHQHSGDFFSFCLYSFDWCTAPRLRLFLYWTMWVLWWFRLERSFVCFKIYPGKCAADEWNRSRYGYSTRMYIVAYHPIDTWSHSVSFVGIHYNIFARMGIKRHASLVPPKKLIKFWHIMNHDDVIKWKRFPRYWLFVRGIHRSPVNSPHIGQWRGALMFSLICAWINGWVNNREAGISDGIAPIMTSR